MSGRDGHPADYWANIWLGFVGAYQGGITADGAGGQRKGKKEVLAPMELFLSHMQVMAP